MESLFHGLMSLFDHLGDAIWSNRPTSWLDWAYTSYVVVVTLGLLLVAVGKKLYTSVLFFAGLAAVMVSFGMASAGSQFHFGAWLLIGVVMLIRPIREYRTHRKMVKAKKVKPAKTAAKTG